MQTDRLLSLKMYLICKSVLHACLRHLRHSWYSYVIYMYIMSTLTVWKLMAGKFTGLYVFWNLLGTHGRLGCTAGWLGTHTVLLSVNYV